MKTALTTSLFLLLLASLATGCDTTDGTDPIDATVSAPDAPSTPPLPLTGAWVLGWSSDALSCSFQYPIWTDLQLDNGGKFTALSGDTVVGTGAWAYEKVDLGAGDSTNLAHLMPDFSDPTIDYINLSSHDAIHMGGIITFTHAGEACSLMARFDRVSP